MEKIKRFVDCDVPVLTCNLRCPYCYITQRRQFLQQLPKFKYSPAVIGNAFSKKRWGGLVHINLCGGGETLLPPEMPEIIYEILKQGHYIAIVTNGTISNRFDEICKFPKEFLSRLLFKFSFHYLELKRLKMLDVFFNNINKVRQAGASFSVELTPDDYYIPYIEEIKKICMDKVGALCHVTVARAETESNVPILTKLSKQEYHQAWDGFRSDLFNFKLSTFYKKRKEFCYAGEWVSFLKLGTGMLKQCYCGRNIQNIFENPEEPIRWEPIGTHCQSPHCHNSHVWLTLGAIPALKTPTYTSMRDRITIQGTHWLTDKMRNFLNGKLCENNKQYSVNEQHKINNHEAWKFFQEWPVRFAKKLFQKLPAGIQSSVRVVFLKYKSAK